MSASDQQAVETTVLDYLEGIRDGAANRISRAFYSSVNLNSVDENGGLVLTPRDALVEYATGPDIPKNTSEILQIEIINDMAFVKARIDMPEHSFFDFLTLLKLKAGWKIVSKTYTTIVHS